jgi:rhamnosyltransferase
MRRSAFGATTEGRLVRLTEFVQQQIASHDERATPAASPLISVVIPVRNGASTLAEALDGLMAQTLGGRLEIIVIDSGSTDGSLDVARRYPLRLHVIASSEFNHGETRNLGARLATGEFVAMTVQDAVPADAHWLERMVKHFDDPKVAGVCGQQITRHDPDKNPLEWFRPYSEPVPKRVWFADPAEFQHPPPAEQVALCAWDDVTAMYRRSVLLAVPYRRVSFGEDMVWARDALAAGHALVYDYSARVYHYHHQTFRFRFRRTFTILYHRYRHFGHSAPPGWLAAELARCTYLASRPRYCPSRRMNWLGYNLRLVLAEWLAGWCFWLAAKVGGRRAVEKGHGYFCPAAPQALRRAPEIVAAK